MLHFKHEYGAAIMFTVAMSMFAAALIAFAEEIRLAVSEVKQCSEQSQTVGKVRYGSRRNCKAPKAFTINDHIRPNPFDVRICIDKPRWA